MISRRQFLQSLGFLGAAAAVPAIFMPPERKIWQVSRNAPVGQPDWASDEGLAYNTQEEIDRLKQYMAESPRAVLIPPNESVVLQYDSDNGL